jgi:MFS transporter, PAT family, beta-lactamase induction signal transducer AmpG
MAASYQLGYRIALLVSGAGALVIGGEFSYPLAYRAMAALMSVGMIVVLFIREPGNVLKTANQNITAARKSGRWLREAVLQPFNEFFERNGSQAITILAFIGIYRISDMVLGVMANPFYLAIGFDETQIAAYVKTVGLGAVLSGAALGGVTVARYGLAGPLIFGAVILALTNLAFAGLAFAGANVPLLVLTIIADNLAQGFTGTVFIAYLSGLTNVLYTATQYALFTSIMVLPGKVLSGFSGAVVDGFGWVSFFVYAAAMGMPAIVLALKIARQQRVTSSARVKFWSSASMRSKD